MPGRNNHQLINRLIEITEPGVLYPWVQAGRLTHMSAPFGDEINQNDKAEIIQIIRDTPSKKINNINVSVIYNNQEQNKIKGIYSAEIEYLFNSLLNSNININDISSLDIGTLENKKQYFQNNFFSDLTSSLSRSEITTLLRPISEEIYTFCWNEVKVNKQIRIQNISEQIDRNKAEQLRLQAERDRHAEQQRRIVEEQKRIQIEQENRKLQKQLEDSKKLEQEKLSIVKEIQKLDALERDYREHIDYLAWHEKAILTSATYIAPENNMTYRHSDMIAGNKKFIEKNREEYNKICKEAERLGLLDIQEKKKREIPTLIKKLDILESIYKTYMEYKAWHEARLPDITFVDHHGAISEHRNSIEYYNKAIQQNRIDFNKVKELYLYE